ncbi:MAG: SsrA-binding protein SmpB [Paludibacteraceae bacterium]|nr:SsrA-binding protein SmpB [Paludibacteraceae bacterium]
MKRNANDIKIKNRRASFDYEFEEKFVAGLQLFGTEIKSLRLGKASLADTFCFFEHGELWVKNMSVNQYFFGSCNNHIERRDRKLLLTKKELRHLEHAVKQTGKTIIPICLFINQQGLAKLEIALAKGKKSFDKRQTIRLREDLRDIQRAVKHF